MGFYHQDERDSAANVGCLAIISVVALLVLIVATIGG